MALLEPLPAAAEANADTGPRDERPALADDVDPVGVLPGSGFDSTQFLVRRGAQFVQVTELLFRTVEAIDGRRTYAEIASRLTEITDWAVTAEIARVLVEEKLAPLGLVTTRGAASAAGDPVAAVPAKAEDRSILSVQAPVTILGARGIERVASVTHRLFAPALAVPLLALVLGAHIWLYLAHGVVNGLLAVLYAPGLLLVVFGLIVVAGVVHEFGHASGLRRGGARAASMGVGLYLVYPAFFTDVTQSYGMPRADRLRTDLGGIYFHLLFALALIGLYVVTGFEPLLLAVVLIDLEAVRQLLPFGRLDGYWVLADLTGIPDPISQIAPFLRRAVSNDRLPGSRLPPLRPWVGRIFVAYIALAVPVLAVFVVFLLSRVPDLVGLAWDALRLQAAQLATAAAASDAAIVGVAALQSALLCLELLATVFIVGKLGIAAMRGIAALGRRGSSGRVAAFALAAVLAGGLAFLWGPYVSRLTANAGPGVAYFDVGSRNHVEGPVRYAQNPPVGGDHSAVWQNCGFYREPVPVEQAVHSMEHGAVWITYRPDLPAETIAELQRFTVGRSHVLVSPRPGDPAPVVASAWGRQLLLDRVDDPRLEQFIRAFRLASSAPERGGPCEGGAGVPAGA